MDDIRVNKTKLIEIMERNRAEHHTIVLEAQAGFREKVIERLDEMLKLAAEGKKIDLNIGLRMPDDHTEEFDTVIGMLKLDIEDTVILNMHQYQSWVENRWNWMNQFLTTNSSYSMLASSKLV